MPRVFLDLCNGLSSSTLFLTEWKSFWAKKLLPPSPEQLSQTIFFQKGNSWIIPLFLSKIHSDNILDEFSLYGSNFYNLWKEIGRKFCCKFTADLVAALPINSTIDTHSSKEFEKVNLFLKREKTTTNRLIFGRESFKSGIFYVLFYLVKPFPA